MITREQMERDLGRRQRGERLLAMPVLAFTWAKEMAGEDPFWMDVPEEMLEAQREGFGAHLAEADVRFCEWEPQNTGPKVGQEICHATL